MDSRRDFIKKASMLAGGAGIFSALPASVQKAMAINPEAGSTFEDAEHIVLLMQENRSFDHSLGSLQGVRGFNDPRAITLPDKNPVWLQTNKAGKTYAPFRLNIKDTKATWMSSLPHSWTNQVLAGMGGRHDNWLNEKQSGNKEYAKMPLTMGHYTREDIPFYYALADAFTVCDQHFCSSLCGTTPNRLYYLTGTIREEQNGKSPAAVNNSNVDYDSPASWTTFPERLEANGIPWKIYQNELSVGVGFEGEEEDWLANFTDNPIEWFSQFHVRFLPAHIRSLPKKAQRLSEAIKKMESDPSKTDTKRLRNLKRELAWVTEGMVKFTKENFDKLPEREQNIHRKAFTTNVNDPDYHKLTSLEYDDNGERRKMQIPKGDVLHQFREDVKNGELPTVSWLMAPENFSDHPGAPWYGAWYVSEVMDILTQNPEVWKKTIFILTYDENDGYFDHVPPFLAPEPGNPTKGKCSAGIDTALEYVTQELVNELKGKPNDPEIPSAIGLGYRVPFVVASPWSRGGRVNSEVCDHTSVLQFLENFLTKKTGKPIVEENISTWRRAVCGDLTSVFRPYQGEEIKFPESINIRPFVESIYNAKFKGLPAGFKEFTKEEIDQVKNDRWASPLMIQQEQGIRASCALPYEIFAEGYLSEDKKKYRISMKAGNEIFGNKSAGVPFMVYDMIDFSIRNYAVTPGDKLTDHWETHGPANENYHFRVYGPNGFYREFLGNSKDSDLIVQCSYETKRKKRPTGNVELHLKNANTDETLTVVITDNAYKNQPVKRKLKPGANAIVPIQLNKSYGWYDFTISVLEKGGFSMGYAGRVETGKDSYSDPQMGRV